MHKVFEILDVNIGAMLIVRLDVFWDKQRVDNCTKSRTEGEVSISLCTLLSFGTCSSILKGACYVCTNVHTYTL